MAAMVINCEIADPRGGAGLCYLDGLHRLTSSQSAPPAAPTAAPVTTSPLVTSATTAPATAPAAARLTSLSRQADSGVTRSAIRTNFCNCIFDCGHPRPAQKWPGPKRTRPDSRGRVTVLTSTDRRFGIAACHVPTIQTKTHRRKAHRISRGLLGRNTPRSRMMHGQVHADSPVSKISGNDARSCFSSRRNSAS